MLFGSGGLINVIVLFPMVLLAITIHEYSHAYMAYKMGDSTARDQGRLTLNPLSHIDIIGALMMLLTYFGWARPVPINPRNFLKYKKGMILVSAAGPLSNLIVGFVSLFLFYLVYKFVPAAWFGFRPLCIIFQTFAVLNVNFGLFNLLPVPPLDGFKIVSVVAPYRFREKLFMLEQYGFVILLLFLFILRPVLSYLSNWVFSIYSSVILYFLRLF